MSVPEIFPAVTIEPTPENLVEVGAYGTDAAAFDHGLVVLAAGQPCWLMPMETGLRLLVEPAAADRVREQLSRYDRESVDWPPRPAMDLAPRRDTDLFTPLLWSLA